MTDRQRTHSHDCWSWGPKHYDGAIIRDVLDHANAVTAVREGPIDVFVAFRPEQIKSTLEPIRARDGLYPPNCAASPPPKLLRSYRRSTAAQFGS